MILCHFEPPILWCSILAATGRTPAVSSEQSTAGPPMAALVYCRGQGQGDHPCIPAGMAGGKRSSAHLDLEARLPGLVGGPDV